MRNYKKINKLLNKIQVLKKWNNNKKKKNNRNLQIIKVIQKIIQKKINKKSLKKKILKIIYKTNRRWKKCNK